MAELTITAASVLQTNGNTQEGIAGATITAGQPVYLDSSTNTYKLAQCDGSTPWADAVVVGISLHAALAGQPLKIQTSGTLAIGATVGVGLIYVLGTTAGLIMPSADLVSTNRLVILGFAPSATTLTLCINNTGIAKA